MGDGRSTRTLRLPLLLASFGLLAAYLMLQAQAAVLQSVAPAVCTPGSPAAIQGGPGQSQPAEVVEIVTGWFRFDVGSDTTVTSPAECAVNVPPPTAPRDATYDIRGTVLWWILTDVLFFVPAYGVLLGLIILWTRRQGWYVCPEGDVTAASSPESGGAGAEQPLLRFVGWLSSRRVVYRLLVVGVLADWVENLLLFLRFDAWWEVLDGGGTLSVDELGLGWLRFVGWLKWAALIVPLLVAVVCAVRQAGRALKLVGKALPMLWPQSLVVVVFVLAVGVPAQSADAVRRLSRAQGSAPWR
jgi:hypothetical protein